MVMKNKFNTKYKYDAPQYKIQFPGMYVSPGAERKAYIMLTG
jgi:hypothetical protein